MGMLNLQLLVPQRKSVQSSSLRELCTGDGSQDSTPHSCPDGHHVVVPSRWGLS